MVQASSSARTPLESAIMRAVAAVAQWIEYWPPKPRVVGSIPASRTIPQHEKAAPQGGCSFFAPRQTGRRQCAAAASPSRSSSAKRVDFWCCTNAPHHISLTRPLTSFTSIKPLPPIFWRQVVDTIQFIALADWAACECTMKKATRRSLFCGPCDYRRSMMMAGAMPPAAHMVIRPRFLSVRSSSSSTVPISSEPVAPMG